MTLFLQICIPQILDDEGGFPSVSEKAWTTRLLTLVAENVWYEGRANIYSCSFVQAHINLLHGIHSSIPAPVLSQKVVEPKENTTCRAAESGLDFLRAISWRKMQLWLVFNRETGWHQKRAYKGRSLSFLSGYPDVDKSVVSMKCAFLLMWRCGLVVCAPGPHGILQSQLWLAKVSMSQVCV